MMKKQNQTLPRFSALLAQPQVAAKATNKTNSASSPYADIPSQLKALLDDNLASIDQLLKDKSVFTWDSLMRPLELIDNTLTKFWAPFSHIHAVCNTADTRTCYDQCLPLLSAYSNKIGHHTALYEAIKSIDQAQLTPTQVKIVHDSLQGFELSGVALSSQKKERFEAISTRQSELSNQFQQNVMDAADAFTYHVTEESRTSGVPEHALHHAKALAEELDKPGWIFTIDEPNYLAIMTHADDRELRHAIHEAFATRASDAGPQAGQFDNTLVMQEILALRAEEATLLGFSDYAHLSLAEKMADSPEAVKSFLNDLNDRSHQQAKAEFASLEAFAKAQGGPTKLEPWDVAYWSEKKQHAEFDISQETLRPYFPLPKVMAGLFEVIERLYGMCVVALQDVETWHKDATCYQITEKSTGQLRGYIYMDLFARQGKRNGAWMNELQSRYKLPNGEIQPPIATLTCNFSKPVGDKPSTLTHDELETLFHECGHCLHHVLTQVDELDASGISGVEWDAVELPSQFFEHWCWERDALGLLSAHVKTGEPLPEAMFERLVASKHFQSAMGMVRQLEFALFDFNLHQHHNPKQTDVITACINAARAKTRVTPTADYDRFQHSFHHIFSGGYAAGYYSYKWAEVLSSDAFSRFEAEGIFNANTGRDFLHDILEVGGSKPAEEAFQAFRGRAATIDALLRHNGIQAG